MTWPEEVADYVMENYPPALQWDYKDLLGWIKWLGNERFIFTCRDSNFRLVGLVVGRPVDRAYDDMPVLADWDINKDGRIIYASIVIATMPGAVQALMEAVTNHFGDRDKFAYHKLGSEHPDRIRVADYNRYRQKLLGESYGR